MVNAVETEQSVNGDHGVLEGDRTPWLKSHGQTLEQECFPSVLYSGGGAPSSLLCQLCGHVMYHCPTRCLHSKQIQHLDILINLLLPTPTRPSLL